MRGENRSTRGKNLSGQSREPTNWIYIWRQVWKLNTATFVEGKFSHHFANPVICLLNRYCCLNKNYFGFWTPQQNLRVHFCTINNNALSIEHKHYSKLHCTALHYTSTIIHLRCCLKCHITYWKSNKLYTHVFIQGLQFLSSFVRKTTNSAVVECLAPQ